MTLLDSYAAAWADGRSEVIAAHWAPADFRCYKAEEIATPFLCWDDVLAYWRANEAMHGRVVLQFTNAVELPLAEGWSAILALMRWDIRFRAEAPAPVTGKAMGGDNHVLALVRSGKLCGWIEAPDAPISYVRRLYEQNARF